jgi:hypothetical protein
MKLEKIKLKSHFPLNAGSNRKNLNEQTTRRRQAKKKMFFRESENHSI